MKFLATIFLMTLIVLQTFAPFVMFAVFFANQKAITEKYCINKNKPMLYCNGKCYLSKKMKQLEQEPMQGNEQNKEYSINIKLDPFTVNYLFAYQNAPVTIKNNYAHLQITMPQSSFVSGVFHPPCFIG